jgi:hypothetical protein
VNKRTNGRKECARGPRVCESAVVCGGGSGKEIELGRRDCGPRALMVGGQQGRKIVSGRGKQTFGE